MTKILKTAVIFACMCGQLGCSSGESRKAAVEPAPHAAPHHTPASSPPAARPELRNVLFWGVKRDGTRRWIAEFNRPVTAAEAEPVAHLLSVMLDPRAGAAAPARLGIAGKMVTVEFGMAKLHAKDEAAVVLVKRVSYSGKEPLYHVLLSASPPRGFGKKLAAAVAQLHKAQTGQTVPFQSFTQQKGSVHLTVHPPKPHRTMPRR